MARVAGLSGTAILDTSWLLELYRVPGYFDEARTPHVLTATAKLIDAKSELFVTVPVLFEVASHITHVRDGRRRHFLGERLRDDITSSIGGGRSDRSRHVPVAVDDVVAGIVEPSHFFPCPQQCSR